MREPRHTPTQSNKNTLLLIESESMASGIVPAVTDMMPDVGVRHHFFWDDLTETPEDMGIQHDVIVYSPIQKTTAHMIGLRMRDFAEHFPKAKVILVPVTDVLVEHPMLVATLCGASYETLVATIRKHLPV